MYYIYEKSSTYIIGKPDRNGVARPDHRQSYKTMAAAKAALTRMSKRYRADLKETVNDPQFRYAIAEAAYFHKHVEKKVKRKVLEGFGGKEYWEPVNTPSYMSPASESYWSM
jgi:hypothetical protein